MKQSFKNNITTAAVSVSQIEGLLDKLSELDKKDLQSKNNLEETNKSILELRTFTIQELSKRRLDTLNLTADVGRRIDMIVAQFNKLASDYAVSKLIINALLIINILLIVFFLALYFTHTLHV